MIAPALRSFLVMNASSGGMRACERDAARGRRHVRRVDVVLEQHRHAEQRLARRPAVMMIVQRVELARLAQCIRR